MLKMTIDNEEVVSDKDITINEEMLSASSTILNNVYPVEWEEDKDYTSRFYYPQDYSKALIQRSYVTQEAEAGTTIQVNGSVTLNDVDTTKNSRVLKLLGQTSQDGTPTPSSPIPVNVVSGDNEIIINGKNQLETYNISGTFNGVDYTLQNGVLTLNGTCTSTGAVVGLGIFRQIKGINYKWTYVYESGTCTDYGGGLFMATTPTSTGSAGYGAGFRTNQSRTVGTFNNGEEHTYYLYMTINKNSVYTNYKIKPLIVQGNDYSYDFEPYIGNTYNINLPVENLFDKSATPISNASTTMSELDTGVRATVTSAGNNRYSAYKLSNSDSLLGKTLNISATITTSGTNNAYIRFYWLNGNTLTSLVAQTINSTGNANFNIPSSYPSGSNGIAILFSSNASGSSSVGDYVDYTNVILTYDKYKGEYTPYGTTPIELCKLGSYQDYIYKDSNKWYLHKEIGKVVLNGSEDWYVHGSIASWFYYDGVTDGYFNNAGSNFALCNYFTQNSYTNVVSITNGQFVYGTPNGGITKRLVIKNTDYTEVANFKTWLSTHNTEVYYVLATPTNTEITYTELLNQLNALSSQ